MFFPRTLRNTLFDELQTLAGLSETGAGNNLDVSLMDSEGGMKL